MWWVRVRHGAVNALPDFAPALTGHTDIAYNAGMEKRLRLITRGDDAGSCNSANEAIVESARHGILRNVSIMAPGPAFGAAVPLLRDLPESVCLGLHVTLNAEWDRVKWGPVLPAAQVPSLVDSDGFFWPTPDEAQRRGAQVWEMLAELTAQLARLREAGLTVRYVDEHMGVSWPWPELRAGIADLARREGLVDAHGIPSLPLEAVAEAPGGTYVYVTHPGFDRDDMRQFGAEPGVVARERDADRRRLTDPRVREALAARGVEIIRYVDL